MTWAIPIGVSIFSDSSISHYSSPGIVFLILGLMYWGQNSEAQKKVNKGDYQLYKAECKGVSWGYASVDNNEMLSTNPRKPTRKIDILGSAKSIRAGDEIGILKTGKDLWAFPLDI